MHYATRQLPPMRNLYWSARLPRDDWCRRARTFLGVGHAHHPLQQSPVRQRYRVFPAVFRGTKTMIAIQNFNEHVRIEADAHTGVATIVLERPERRNAVDRPAA